MSAPPTSPRRSRAAPPAVVRGKATAGTSLTAPMPFRSFDEAYRAGYSATTIRRLRHGFRRGDASSVDVALGFYTGANAFACADRYGVDLSTAGLLEARP